MQVLLLPQKQATQLELKPHLVVLFFFVLFLDLVFRDLNSPAWFNISGSQNKVGLWVSIPKSRKRHFPGLRVEQREENLSIKPAARMTNVCFIRLSSRGPTLICSIQIYLGYILRSCVTFATEKKWVGIKGDGADKYILRRVSSFSPSSVWESPTFFAHSRRLAFSVLWLPRLNMPDGKIPKSVGFFLMSP